jgi:hypothetical protein
MDLDRACPCCGAPMPFDEDVRPIKPRWIELVELVEGARSRGWPEEFVAYLAACMGIAWAKAFRRGAARAEEAAPS